MGIIDARLQRHESVSAQKLRGGADKLCARQMTSDAGMYSSAKRQGGLTMTTNINAIRSRAEPHGVAICGDDIDLD